tara:strand:- start:175 stop:432 length:258 start_codon:yes stop_codon:yes gene_type:complete
MNRLAQKQEPTASPHLLGIGLDSEDGHTRITRAEDFSIVGGSEQTHDAMTETVCKTFEDLKQDGKNLENVEQDQLRDLLHKNTPG